MNKFLRWYNVNKIAFWTRVLIVVGIYIVILLFNNLSSNKNITNTKIDNITSENNDTFNYIQQSTIKQETSMLGNPVNKDNLKIANSLIDKFISLCNNKDYENAYKMLSTDCKEQQFSSVEEFKQYYCSNIFMTGSKDYNMQNWSGQTYKIEYRDSIMSTGGKRTEEYIQDYMTIVEENNSKKLNINSYIKKVTLKKQSKIDNVNISVVEKNVFMNYEIYKIKIQNDSQYLFLLDSLKETNTIYLTDSNNIKYYAFINELNIPMVEVRPKTTKTIEVRFSNSYNPSRKMSNIVFNEVIMNKNLNNKKVINIEL